MKQPTFRTNGGGVNSLFLLTLFMLAYMAAIGFGTVWLRYEISVTANVNKELESDISDAQRRLSEVTAEVAFAQSPEQLLKKNKELGVNLVRPREEQVVRESGDVERRLAAKRYGLFLSTATTTEQPQPGSP